MSRSPRPPEQLGPFPPSAGGPRQLVIVIILLTYLTITFGGVLTLAAYLLAEKQLTVASGTAVAAIATAAALAARRMTAAFISLLYALGLAVGSRGGDAGADTVTG